MVWLFILGVVIHLVLGSVAYVLQDCGSEEAFAACLFFDAWHRFLGRW